jgi:predicted cupin superfamily sugar epimerase
MIKMQIEKVQQKIDNYKLSPHPEGGYYKEIYRSSQEVLSPVTGEVRNSITHIYFLLAEGEISRFHRVEHDEIWNFYEGDPIRLVLFDGEKLSEQTIGSGCNDYTLVVPAGVWQAAESTGEYSLVGCSVAPGFDFKDFRFMSDEEADRVDKNEYRRFI